MENRSNKPSVKVMPGMARVKKAAETINSRPNKDEEFEDGVLAVHRDLRKTMSALTFRAFLENGDDVIVPWSIWKQNLTNLNLNNAPNGPHFVSLLFNKIGFLVRADRETIERIQEAAQGYHLKAIFSGSVNEATGKGVEWIRVMADDEEGGGDNEGLAEAKEGELAKVQQLIAMASNTSSETAEVLADLAKSEYVAVRVAVAKNTATKGAVLSTLLVDGDEDVRKVALGNKNMTAAQFKEAMRAIQERDDGRGGDDDAF